MTAASGASTFRQALAVAGTGAPVSEVGTAGGLPSDYRIQSGDTLTAIVRDHLQATGQQASAREIRQGIEQVALANGIENPDRIYAGNSLDLTVLQSLKTQVAGKALDASGQVTAGPTQASAITSARSATPSTQQTLAARVELVQAAARSSVGSTSRPSSTESFLKSAYLSSPPAGGIGKFSQLEKTLDRAVERGFIQASERGPVRDRVVEMAQKYRFSPDDFATVALMESDGFNPRASNGRCHGIIQFCEGSGRGAASVGLQSRAREILDRPVLEQMELVDRYFEDTGLKDFSGPVGLVDLYLTVLTPAARNTRQPDAALPVGGVQAKALHVRGDRDRPITRNSILAGLQSHANAKLAELTTKGQGPQVSSTSPIPGSSLSDRMGRSSPMVDAGVLARPNPSPRS